MIDEAELKQIIDAVESAHAHTEQVEDDRVISIKRVRRFKHRIIICGVLTVVCIITHYTMEHYDIKNGLQTIEILIAAFFDSLFGKAREV